MNIEEAKKLLRDEKIPFEEAEYPTQRAYWRHVSEFWRLEYAKDSPDSRVRTLVVRSNNGKKDPELEFSNKNGEFLFVDLLFGSFSMEIEAFSNEDYPVEEILLERLSDVMENRITVLTVNDKASGVLLDAYQRDFTEEERERLLEGYMSLNGASACAEDGRFVMELYDRDRYDRVEFSDLKLSESVKALLWDRRGV